MEPTTVSREQLIDLVTEQRAVIEVQRAAIERLEARVAELEAGSGKPKGLAGNKLMSRPDKPKEPCKKRDRNFVRRRTQHPDERVSHAYEACPVCGTGLGGGTVKRTRQVIEVCKPYLAHEGAPQAVLCRRIERYIKELFVFVSEPGVPPDNNGAERSLRPLVTQRKISGGTRSAAGTHTQMTLASLFGTWRARALNPYHSCLALLDST